MCSIRPQSHLHHLQGFGNLQGLCHLQRILLLGFCVGRIFSDYGSSLFLANAYDDSDILLGLEPFWADLLLGLEPFWANWGTLSCKCNSLSGWGSCHLLLALVKFCALIIWIKLWHYYYTHMFIYFAKHVLLRFFCFNLLVCHNKASVEDLDKIVDLTTIQMRSTVDKNNVRMWLDLIVLGYCRVFVGVFSSVVNLWSASWCGCLLSLFFLSFFLHFSFFLSFFLSCALLHCTGRWYWENRKSGCAGWFPTIYFRPTLRSFVASVLGLLVVLSNFLIKSCALQCFTDSEGVQIKTVF